MDLMTASHSVGSYRAEPYSVNEIDAHTDADRIWATVVRLRSEYEREEDDDESYDAGIRR